MAPSPEYDKEPKAPDKSAANISIIETKAPHSLLNDQQTISENKSSNTNTSVEVENNKNVEHLDDGQLKALLDEAITYKCPKDREGKSSLFNELLEEVEQDEQALEAARGAGAGAARARRGAGGGRSRRALPHSNSLQNLEQEALAAECALRRVRNHAPVSARAGHGGSLPSDVDKSFLVGEEPRAGYLATVRCVNPPPLAERRVSASDANGPAELELLNRRSKPPFQMTYTARATLEISGSSVSSGRAVTTTTASNQVRTRRPRAPGPPEPDRTPYLPNDHNNTKQRKTSKVVREVNRRAGGADGRVDTAGNETWHSERARPNETWHSERARPNETWHSGRARPNETWHSERARPNETWHSERARPNETWHSERARPNETWHSGRARPKLDIMDVAVIRNLIQTVGVTDKTHRGRSKKPTAKKETDAQCHRQKQLMKAVVPNVGSDAKNSAIKQTEATEIPAWASCRSRSPSPPELYRTPYLPNDHNKTKQCKTSKPVREVNQRDGGADGRVDTAGNETWHSGHARPNETWHSGHARPNETWHSGRARPNETWHSERARPKLDIMDVAVIRDLIQTVGVTDKTHRGRSKKATAKKETNTQCHSVGGDAKNFAIKQTEATEKPAWAINYTTKKGMPRNGATKNTTTKQTEAKKLACETNCTSRKESPRESRNKVSDGDNKNFYMSKNVCSDEVRNNPDTDYLYTTRVNMWYQGLDRYQLQSSLTNTSNQTPIQDTNNNIPNDNLVPYMPTLYETSETVDSLDVSINQIDDDESPCHYDDLTKQAFAAIYPPDRNVDDDVYNQHTGSTSRPRSVRGMQPKINKPQHILRNLVPADLSSINSRNILNMTTGPPAKYQPTASTSRPRIVREMQPKLNKPPAFLRNLKSYDDSYINPRNIRKMSIGTPSITREDVKAASPATDIRANRDSSAFDKEAPNDCDNRNCSIDNRDPVCNLSVNKSCVRELSLDQDNAAKSANNITSKAKLVPRTQSITGESVESLNKSKFNMADSTPKLDLTLNPDNTKASYLNADESYIDNGDDSTANYIEMKSVNRLHVEDQDVELKEMVTTTRDINLQSSFAEYMQGQERLMKLLKLEDNRIENNITPDKISVKESENVMSENIKQSEEGCNECDDIEEINSDERSVVKLESYRPGAGAQYVLDELPNNSYVLLTFPSSLSSAIKLEALAGVLALWNSMKQKSVVFDPKDGESTIISGNPKALRFCDVERSRGEPAEREAGARDSEGAGRQVDSAIPFNCITTSEVADSAAAAASPPAAADDQKSRGATFNGLPLPRAAYGATAAASPEEFKKSLDENGNSLQGLSSPLSGSSQLKKPRRKKSSKNETVMTSDQIDGYKGDKDLNEVLRFIESAAGGTRAPKLPHRKHAHDDDKGKKRSAERRKDKEPEPKRASSLEELSRTTLEELTDEPRRHDPPAPAKPERRSWGDDARDYYAEPAPDGGGGGGGGGGGAQAASAGFQTVTKKRRPRRRDERDEPRARAPEPRPRRVSAPPSDRSGDSNDDLDSVHSLPALTPRGAPTPAAPPAPAPAAPAPAAVSYADIARTRHNIPDLIESCNFYAEGPPPAEPPPAVVDADTYPALEPRRPQRANAAAAPAGGKPATEPPRTQDPPRRKERCSSLAESVVVAESPPPAPDVVADRRPPVILLDSASRPKDMDGITFGFDINEQLLGGPAPRPRCDLVRDALEVWDGGDGGGGSSVAPAEGSVAVVAGCAALRYVPPEPPADTHHLLQIVDYVGSAWEDVVRCGSGKVRYFSE